MKWIISFFVSIFVYLGLGLVAWNVVSSFQDIDSMTLVEIANCRLFTYSALTYIYVKLIPFILGDKTNDSFDIFIIAVIGINLIIAVIFNCWDGAWGSVITIMNVVYNLINVGLMTLMTRGIFSE